MSKMYVGKSCDIENVVETQMLSDVFEHFFSFSRSDFEMKDLRSCRSSQKAYLSGTTL